MKRKYIGLLVLFVVTGSVWGQLGSRPSGFSDYRSDDMELSFHYPNGWFVLEMDGGLTVANREALLESVDTEMDMPDLKPGDTAMVIGMMPTFFMMMMGIPTDDITMILDGMFDNIVSSDEGNLDNSATEVLEFEGRRVATVTFDDSSQDASGIFLVAHEQEDVILFGVAYGYRDSLDRNRKQLARTIASVEFTGDLASMLQ
jgi:hypothetical protein